MDRISTLIASLEDYKLRSKARMELSRMAPSQVCPQLMNYLQKEHANVNGIWAALVVLKKFRWMPVLDLWDVLVDRYASLSWDLKELKSDLTGESLSDIEDEFDEKLNPFHEVRELLGLELLQFEDKGSFYSFVIKTELTRKHELIVMEEHDLLHIYTECGEADDHVAEQLAELNESLDLGELKVDRKEGHAAALSLHYAMSKESSAADQETVLRRMAQVADGLEKQLSNEDKI